MQLLDFHFLDDLALAVQRNRVSGRSLLNAVEIERIGPLLELLVLGRPGSLEGVAVGSLSGCPIVDQLRSAIRRGTTNGSIRADAGTKVGFITTGRNPASEDQSPWTAFCFAVQQAAEFSGLPKQQARGLVGAMREIEENIHLHSQRPMDGVVGYRATKQEFEFVVADSGIGTLASLKLSPDYQHLSDSGTAIRIALTDGESRLKYENQGHGYGFHGLFVGLANLNGHLRFRSDDHALTIDGSSPSLMTTRLSQTARLQGFVASIVCRSANSLQLH